MPRKAPLRPGGGGTFPPSRVAPRVTGGDISLTFFSHVHKVGVGQHKSIRIGGARLCSGMNGSLFDSVNDVRA